jgi:hypothetical protein
MFQQLVPLLRQRSVLLTVTHAHEACLVEDVFRQRQTRIAKHWIDGVIASHIPAFRTSTRAAGVMLQGWMHHFVGEGPNQLSTAQRLDKLWVEIERHSVSRHGCDRAARPRAKAKQQGAEKGMIQQQRRARFLNAHDARECGCDLKHKLSSLWP